MRIAPPVEKTLAPQQQLASRLTDPINGQRIVDAIARSQCSIRALNDARRIEPEVMHAPMTR